MFNDDLHADAQALLPGRTTEAGATRRTALQVALGGAAIYHGKLEVRPSLGEGQIGRAHV